MTASFNLSQLANNLNTSGQIDATDGLTGLIANANLASSGTASSSTFLRGDRTWATVSSSGRILQSLQTTTTTQVINNSSTYTSVGLSLSITPAATSSKILAIACIPVTFGDNAGNAYIGLRITRAGTQITETVIGNNVSAIVQEFKTVAMSYLDSPSTTSAITYQVDFKEYQIASRYGNTLVCNNSYGAPMATLQLLEIGA
jgi:hypothetical protein